MNDPKPVEFRASWLDDLRAFPVMARREAGYQIDRVQNGHEPDDRKPMPAIGSGVEEIRIRDVAARSEWFMSQNSPTQSTCFTVFRRKQ